MPFTCATCFQALSTTTSLKRHVRRFQPNTNEEQIMCKTCNIPCTDKYNLKRHNTRFHGDEIPALRVSSIETSKEKNSSDDNDVRIGEEEQNVYCEPGVNYIRGDHAELHKLQESGKKKCEPGMKCIIKDHTELHKIQESGKKKNPINIREPTCSKSIKAKEIHTEEVSDELTPGSTSVPVQDEITRDVNSGETQSISNDNSEVLLKLAIAQQRNTDFITQNTLHLLKMLEITKELVKDFESSKIYQAKELQTKTYNCRICNRLFENSASLANHKSKYHRFKSVIVYNCQQCNLIFSSETNLTIHNYRCHRASL